MDSAKSFNAILDRHRSEAASQADIGKRFERLMANFLRTYQVYDGRFSDVWLWDEFPYRSQISGHDIGIDIVARTIEDKFWAVQCKCFAADAYISKRHVDTFLGPSGKEFTDASGNRIGFAARLWLCTTNNWSSEAQAELKNQAIPCQRVSLSDLESAAVDWDLLDLGRRGSEARLKRKELRDHQRDALEACCEEFRNSDKCKITMACGTGKTLASLRIAERMTGGRGLVLFFAPSIALIGQTLKEYSANAAYYLHSICVCSDPQVSKAKRDDDDDLTSVSDLALPATTKVSALVERIQAADSTNSPSLVVIFSTYQSIKVVAEALGVLGKTADLIVCDEAHRTTGVKMPGAAKDESYFVKVHDDAFLKASKRLYMTATPRIFSDNAKSKAGKMSATLCSMDDEAIYGREAYHIGFGEAVDRGLLSDYKVLILTVNNGELSKEAMDELIAGAPKEVEADDITKLIGCVQALSKNMIYEGGHLLKVDPGPMRKAVAFCQTIASSKAITEIFNRVVDAYRESLPPSERNAVLDVASGHVDGGMGASTRDGKMAWLKSAPADEYKCHILTNVRCLSEGIDVPTLDAVMFLSAKSSEIEVVQSVGRVMRRAENKKFGYVIVPVVVPTWVKPEDVLKDHARFKIVWTVLNSIKSHDDRFDSLIRRIELNTSLPDGGGSVLIGGIAHQGGDDESLLAEEGAAQGIKTEDLLAEFRDGPLCREIYARLVTNVGSRRDILSWASDVAKIAEGFKAKITETVKREGPHKEEFDKFLEGLRAAINPAVDDGEAIEMLSQHLITKPVFEALFDNHAFIRNNPVSQAMEGIIGILEPQGFDRDRATLDRFYKSVQIFVSGYDNAFARQKTIVDLYNNFFKIAAPKTVEKLGIVYTPVQVVDFINNSVAEVLRREFGRDISDEGVHVLDPFAGSGTFMARLIESGLIRRDSLERKFAKELHANEIVLLAYYIASVNIEVAFHGAMGEDAPYAPFGGICLTDTFQLHEAGRELLESQRMGKNTARLVEQKRSPVMVVLGNPPWSAGQRSANDNAQNQSYPVLERRIADTYAARSSATLKHSLFDSYCKAIRWSSDRLPSDSGGVVAFVTNGGWLDGNAMDGMRKCLAEEFAKIFVFNLRGNQRTLGELSRREGGKIFGSGSRAPVAISILIKKPGHQGPAEIFHHDVGDYLKREEKLDNLTELRDIYNPRLTWERITPNEAGDWLNQRTDIFSGFCVIGDKKAKEQKTFFTPSYSQGLNTSRASWCYNYSKINLINNIKSSISFYNIMADHVIVAKENKERVDLTQLIDYDPTKFSWDRQQKKDVLSGKKYDFSLDSVRRMIYRPFNKQFGYFNRQLNNCMYLLAKLFPTNRHQNLLICVPGIGVTKDFSTIMINITPDLELIGKSQCFPRYHYEPTKKPGNSLFPTGGEIDGYKRHDAITDCIHKEAAAKYGPEVTKDDLFYYVYGFLHSEDYRAAFSTDLKKSLPRIPLVDGIEVFRAFSKAGRELAELHLNYETVEPYAGAVVTGQESGDFRVGSIKFAKLADKDDKTAIIYNSSIKISGVPLEAYDYVVSGKSALEWLLDRYRVKVDKESGIKNDPNDWAKERDQPRYILDLILSLITVSLETMRIVRELPRLKF